MKHIKMTFQAVQFLRGSAPFTVNKIPDLAINDNEVLVKIAFTAINPVDLVLKHTVYFNFFSRPYGFGREYSAVVERVGKNVTQFAQGDHIVGGIRSLFPLVGAAAQYYKFQPGKANAVKVPKSVSLETAAASPVCLLSAYQQITDYYKVDENTKVLLLGGGTLVGLFGLQLLKNVFNVKDVVSVNSSKTDGTLKTLGLTGITTVNYDKVDSKAEVLDVIAQKFNGEKFDLVIDAVGGTDFIDAKYIKPNKKSQYVTVAGDKVATYGNGGFQFFQLSLILRTLGLTAPKGFGYHMHAVKIDNKTLQHAADLLESGKVKPVVDSIYPIDKINDAVTKLATHHAKGKILIAPNEV